MPSVTPRSLSLPPDCRALLLGSMGILGEKVTAVKVAAIVGLIVCAAVLKWAEGQEEAQRAAADAKLDPAPPNGTNSSSSAGASGLVPVAIGPKEP